MSETGILVTMRHIRKAKMCTAQVRVFFERHGLDWPDFLKNGMDSGRVRDLNDAMATKVAEIAEAEHE